MGILDAPGLTATTGELKQIYGATYLKAFRAALAQRSTTPIDIVFIGDSKTEGTGASAANTRWINQWLNEFRAAYQPPGVVGGFGYVPGNYITTSFGQPWTISGGATRATSYGLGKRNIFLSGAGHSASLTVGPATPYGGVTSIDIVYLQGSTAQGTFSVVVDGGAPTNINATTSPTTPGKRYRISGLDPTTSHTVVVSFVSGTQVAIEGAMLYNGDETSGIRLWDAGHHGIRASNYTNLTELWWQSITAVNPSLIYYQLGRNDFDIGANAVSTIVSNVTAQINLLKTLCTVTPSIIYGMDWNDKTSTNIDTYTNWHAAMRQMALTDGTIAFYDLLPVIGNTTTAGNNIYGFAQSDLIHASATIGHPAMADAFNNFIEGKNVRDSVRRSGDTMTGILNMSGLKIISVADPTNAQDAATKNYVDLHAGTGTVTSLSVASSNGFSGTVSNPTTTPTITLSTSVTGLLKGNGTSVSAATAGSDYLTPSTGVSSLAGTTNQVAVSASVGSVTLSLPQNIDSSATPTFGALTLNGDVSFGGTTNRSLLVGRATTGAGVALILQGGGAQSGGTDLAGGDLQLKTGISVGNARANIKFYAPSNSGTGSTDNTPNLVAVLFAPSSAGPILSLGTVTGSSSGLPSGLGNNVYALTGNNAGGVAQYRHTTANTAGNSLTIAGGGATSGATDKSGGDVIIKPGISTGTGGGNVRIQTMTRALSTGTSDNTATDRIIVTSPKSVTNNSATTLATLTQASGSVVAGQIHYAVEVTDGTDFQVEEGTISYHVTNKGGVTANNVALKSANQQAATAGTLAVTFTVTSAASPLIQVNANSSLTPSTGYPRVTYTLTNLTQQAVTIS